MRKLVESTFMTLDGVISNPQEWSPPFWDDEHSAYAEKLLAPADAMLLGRATYENFAASWPGRSRGLWRSGKTWPGVPSESPSSSSPPSTWTSASRWTGTRRRWSG